MPGQARLAGWIANTPTTTSSTKRRELDHRHDRRQPRAVAARRDVDHRERAHRSAPGARCRPPRRRAPATAPASASIRNRASAALDASVLATSTSMPRRPTAPGHRRRGHRHRARRRRTPGCPPRRSTARPARSAPGRRHRRGSPPARARAATSAGRPKMPTPTMPLKLADATPRTPSTRRAACDRNPLLVRPSSTLIPRSPQAVVSRSPRLVARRSLA